MCCFGAPAQKKKNCAQQPANMAPDGNLRGEKGRRRWKEGKVSKTNFKQLKDGPTASPPGAGKDKKEPAPVGGGHSLQPCPVMRRWFCHTGETWDNIQGHKSLKAQKRKSGWGQTVPKHKEKGGNEGGKKTRTAVSEKARRATACAEGGTSQLSKTRPRRGAKGAWME